MSNQPHNQIFVYNAPNGMDENTEGIEQSENNGRDTGPMQVIMYKNVGNQPASTFPLQKANVPWQQAQMN